MQESVEFTFSSLLGFKKNEKDIKLPYFFFNEYLWNKNIWKLENKYSQHKVASSQVTLF